MPNKTRRRTRNWKSGRYGSFGLQSERENARRSLITWSSKGNQRTRRTLKSRWFWPRLAYWRFVVVWSAISNEYMLKKYVSYFGNEVEDQIILAKICPLKKVLQKYMLLPGVSTQTNINWEENLLPEWLLFTGLTCPWTDWLVSTQQSLTRHVSLQCKPTLFWSAMLIPFHCSVDGVVL